ncbi:MAG TPA: thioredoxin family protein [Pirellulales bacterium]|nr:thioredoxin family protein [Pirellulales bacterium]
MLATCLCLWTALASATFAEAPSATDGLEWETDLETAQRVARDTNRLVLIHFGGPWCEPCQTLEKQVFSRPGFGRELRARFVAVKVDPRDHGDLAGKYGVKTVPTDVVITPRGQMIYRVGSPNNAAAYVDTMNRIADSVQPLGETANAVASLGRTSEPPPQQPAPMSDPTDRYADYHRSRQTGGDQRPDSGQPQTNQEPPHATAVSMRPQVVDHSQAGDTQQPAARPQPKTITPAAKPAGNPPIALDGYCAVTLVERRVWHTGDKRWGAIHRGRTYLFASEPAQKAFLADPDRYSPVLSGNDPVMRLDHNQDVPGKREHGAFYNDRIYLFANEQTFLLFDRDPTRYTIENRQALRR